MSSLLLSSRSYSLDDMPFDFNPSTGANDVDLSAIERRLKSLRTLSTGAASNLARVPNSKFVAVSLTEQLRAKLVSLKSMTASVAMYFHADWRSKLFSRLDVLLNSDNWEEGALLPSEQSFSTLLRMMIYLHPTRRPTIGLSPSGHFVTAWKRGDDKLVIECIGNDDVRWVISREVDGDRESAAGKVSLHRVPEVTAAYDPEGLYTDDQNILT